MEPERLLVILKTIFEWVQTATSLVILFLLVQNIRWMLMNRARFVYGMPIFLLVIHGLTFYGYNLLIRWDILLHPVISPFFTYWSSALRLHEFMTLALMEGLRVSFSKDRESNEKDAGKY